MTINEQQRDVLDSVRCLSDGTIGTLTGEREYAILDRIRGRWIDFLHFAYLQDIVFDSWVSAWHAFRASKEFYNG